MTDDGESSFCATDAPTGSHILPPCMSESEWVLLHPDMGSGPNVSSGTVESGRSSLEGTLGY